MFTDPGNYAVIDIRGWELLHAVKGVKGNESGTKLMTDQLTRLPCWRFCRLVLHERDEPRP
jgi:hypothetical protein